MKFVSLLAASISAGLLLVAGCGKSSSTPSEEFPPQACLQDGLSCSGNTVCCSGLCEETVCQTTAVPACLQSRSPCILADAGVNNFPGSNCCPGLNCVFQCPDFDEDCACPTDGGICEWRTCT